MIRPVGAEWFDFPAGSDPYVPSGIPFTRVPASVDGRIVVEGCEFSFSYEDPGVQVTFHGPLSESRAQEIAEAIRRSIEVVSGETGRVVQID